MTDDLIHRGTAGLGEVEVVERRGVAVSLHACLVNQSVNLISGHPWPHCSGTNIQNFSPQLSKRETE